MNAKDLLEFVFYEVLRMKIAILVPSFSKYSGDARVAELQAREFVSRGDKVAIFALEGDLSLEGVEIYKLGVIRGTLFERTYRLLFPLDLPKILKWLPKLKEYDLIISHLYPMNWLAFLAKKFYKIPYVFYNHGTNPPELFPKLYERIYLRFYLFLNKLTTKNADDVISVSEYARKELREQLGLESRVEYNRINTNLFHSGVKGSAVREKHGLGDAPVMLFVGRIAPQKRVDLLVKAFKLVKQRIPSARLIIVGEHTYEYYSDMIREMCDGSVIFVDSLPHEELACYYAACDVYATTSYWESFNLPLAEAQACGKPVVAFDVGPHREVINEEGRLVEKGDLYGFADACAELLSQSRKLELLPFYPKIAILVPSFTKYSGDARVAERQAKELVREGNEVAIFALGGDIQPPPPVKLYIMGMPKSSVLERTYRLMFPLDFVKINKWLPKLKEYDTVISHLYPMHWLAYLLKKRYNVKYVYYDHGIDKPEYFPKIYEKIYLRFFMFFNKLAIRNVDKAISVSKFASQELKKLFGIESEVKYNKINTNLFHKGLDGSKVREKYNLGDAPLILFVGRVTPQKGVHLLIKAHGLIKRKIPEAKLMIVGEHTYDYYSRELRQISDGSVIFVGSVSHEELAEYYAACDVYATCSLRESFNLPAAEARACGKPVVAFNIGPHREILNSKGVLVDEGDIAEFADACVGIIKQHRPEVVVTEGRKKRKICLVCSHGGHLTELLRLIDAFEGHEWFFMTYDVVRTRKLKRKYLLKNIGKDPLKLLTIIPGILRILHREKPDLIVSTGAEIAIPVFYIGKLLFGIKTVYIESWCRIKEPSHTGRIVYPVSDWFLVQWTPLLKKYGSKARYKGAVF